MSDIEPSEDYDEIEILIDGDPIKLGKRCRDAEARAERLGAALGKYGAHYFACLYMEGQGCTCGFRDALHEL